jgi:hypothetical protein
MAFEQLDVQTKSAGRLPAAITLYRYGNSGEHIPAGTAISLRSDLVEQAGFSPASLFNVFIGSGEDAGKLRLVQAANGKVKACFMKRTNAFFVRLGVVAAIGLEPCPRTEIQARVIERGTVEVDIPELVPAADQEAAEGNAQAGQAAKAPPVEVFYHGITIDTTAGEETVTFDGEGIAVSAIEARLVLLLARPRPTPVAETFLIANLWGTKQAAPKNAAEQLRQLCAGDLKKGLAKLGLNLAPVPGVGYQLKDA